MKKIDLLKKEFQNSKIEFENEILTNLSTKIDDGKIFPPYIPFVGNNYKEYRYFSTQQHRILDLVIFVKPTKRTS